MASDRFSPCVVVPYYNHPEGIKVTLARLLPLCREHKWPIYLVDDGSDLSSAKALDEAILPHAGIVQLKRFQQNKGKGAAVVLALEWAQQLGHSHAVQVDADAQHAVEDMPAMLALAEANSKAVVAGQPRYDKSVPKGRLYGRYITHVWVWIHTLSFAIADSMCGFRVYPLAATVALTKHHNIASRMDFDTDIIVRLFWRGAPVINFPTHVTYPVDGLSHFQMLRDNLRISRMHARLFCGLLLRLPWYLPMRLCGKR